MPVRTGRIAVRPADEADEPPPAPRQPVTRRRPRARRPSVGRPTRRLTARRTRSTARSVAELDCIRFDPALLRAHWRPLALGLTLKLVVLPALFLILYVSLLSARGLAVHVTILQSAMSPMITSAVLAAELGLDIELAGSMLGVGIPLSLVTVPLWNILLKAI